MYHLCTGTFWKSWASPLRGAEIDPITVSNFADNVIAATRLANNTILWNVKAFMTFVEHEKDDA